MAAAVHGAAQAVEAAGHFHLERIVVYGKLLARDNVRLYHEDAKARVPRGECGGIYGLHAIHRHKHGHTIRDVSL